MGYTICWKPTRKYSSIELHNMNVIWKRHYYLNISKIKSKGFVNTDHYEWAGDALITNKEFDFMKTARMPYDYAVKKAFMEVQKATNNLLNVYCDDGFKYTKAGLLFNDDGYTDEYKPKTPISTILQLSDLPIQYEIVKGEIYTNGEYNWNQGKKPKMIGKKSVEPDPELKLYRGSKGGVYYINPSGQKTYLKGN